MNNAIKLDIKSPCSENFNTFKPTANGGFCNSCQHEVVDFTKMSSEEIITYFNTKNTTNTCGRFKNTQLSTINAVPKRSRLSWMTGFGLACLSLFSFGTTQAQEKNTDNTTNSIKSTTVERNITVKGTIVDQDGLPLPSATILLVGTNKGTTTDFDGHFEFPEKLKKGDMLSISYVGYESKKVKIDSDSTDTNIQLNVDMSLDSCVIMGKVATKKVYKSKRD